MSPVVCINSATTIAAAFAALLDVPRCAHTGTADTARTSTTWPHVSHRQRIMPHPSIA